MSKGNARRWPLVLIATPAAVAIWSGWVGLGQLCGFGPVNLLPGIGGGLTLNTAITLPVGVEAYAAFALGAWMAPGAGNRARRFAGWSALGALTYGMLGQVTFHLLRSHGYTVAPPPVVVLVSCMPVAVLGLAAALTHLLAGNRDTPGHAVSVPGLRPLMGEYKVGQPVARKMQEAIVKYSSPAGVSNPSEGTAPAGAGGRDATSPNGVPAALNGRPRA